MVRAFLLVSGENLRKMSTMLRKLNYISVVMLTLPVVPFAVITGLVETIFNSNSDVTLWIVRPFVWAVERKTGRAIRTSGTQNTQNLCGSAIPTGDKPPANS